MAILKWVKERTQNELIPELASMSTEEEVKARCLQEIEHWRSERGLKDDSMRNPHTQARKYVEESTLPEQIKVWTIQYLNLGAEHWYEANHASLVKLVNRLEQQLVLREPDRIIMQAEALLESPRWADIAAGLAILTGRRSTEILKTAKFEYKSPYVVTFSGQLKQRGHTTTPFDIPTLTEAEAVIVAFNNLRGRLSVENLSADEVSSKFHKGVINSVKRHFEVLIPTRENEGLNTRTLRAVYLRLAIFFYCPALTDPETFVARISGHRTYLGDEEAISFGAGANYRDYEVADKHGNLDRRKGVKLGADGVEVLSDIPGASHGASSQLGASNGILSPEALFVGEDLQLIKDGMEAAHTTDFMTYLTTALKKLARADLGIARRDTVIDMSELSMDDLLKKRKRSTSQERFKRAVEAIARHNDTHSALERWFINSTSVFNLVGGRFQAAVEYLKEHEEEVKAINEKHNLTKADNRKPIDIKDSVEVE